MLADRIIATIGLLAMVVFLGFLVVYVDALDLWIVIVVVSAMAAYDFVQSLRNGSRSPRG